MKQSLFLLSALFFSYVSTAQSLVDSLTQELEQLVETSAIPGFSVAIVNADEVLYQQGFGYANKEKQTAFTTETMENLGSVSKTVVGLALVKAIEEGKLTLDTEINRLLPFPIQNPYFQDTPLLVRHLADHTSSILDTKHYGKSYLLDANAKNEGDVHQDYLDYIKSHEPLPLKDFLFHILSKKGKWYKKKNFLKTQPGTKKEYTNLNAALTAYLIELATAIPFATYTQQNIFSPLKMEYTTWDSRDIPVENLATPYFPIGKVVPRYHLITYPDGGLISNIKDLSIFLSEMIKAYANQSEYLPIEYAQLLLPGDEDNNRAFWGMGQKSRNIGHGGSDPGVQTDLQFNADRKIGRIILANVNAEDNEALWQAYRKIHTILATYEDRFVRD